MANHRLAIIVLNWNGATDAIACMDSLFTQIDNIPDIILVDNDSHDTSIDVLDEYCRNNDATIHFIKNNVNSGFTGGNNVGITYALEQGYEYIGTLNPDAVADKEWATSLVTELQQHPQTGIATGILARSDRKTIDSTGDFYTTWGIPSPRGRDSLLANAPAAAEYVFGATGGGFIARASMLRKIGVFDEKFFMYFEDVDLCFRAQLAGYKVRYTPKAIAYHKLSASTNKVPGLAVYNTFKNLPMLYGKNVPAGLWWKIWPRFALAYTLILGNAIARGRGAPALKGWLRSITLISHTLHERRRIQASRTVTTEYVDSIILHDIPPEQTGLRKFRDFFVRGR